MRHPTPHGPQSLTENHPGYLPHFLFFPQHDHVFTIGKRPNAHNILSDPFLLTALDVEVHRSRRGGDVTYHGPGQTILYPIVNLRALGVGARRYVETLEDVMVETCAGFGIDATGRVPGMTGTWVGDKKIGALGVQIAGGVTTHGLAFNVRPDLEYFKHIVPCGLRGKRPTSLAKEMERKRLLCLKPNTEEAVAGITAGRAEVEAKLVTAFMQRFGYDDVSMHRE